MMALILKLVQITASAVYVINKINLALDSICHNIIRKKKQEITERVYIRHTDKLKLETRIVGKLQLQLQLQYNHHSFNFFNLIQCIVICRYICIVNFVESDHYWVASLWVLSNGFKTKNQTLYLSQQKNKIKITLEGRESTDLVNSYNRSNAIVPVGLPPKNLNLQKGSTWIIIIIIWPMLFRQNPKKKNLPISFFSWTPNSKNTKWMWY